jgi:hypothetical protein
MPLDVTLTWYSSIHLDCQCQHGGHTNVQGWSDSSNKYPGVLKLFIVVYLHIYAAFVNVMCLHVANNKMVAP